MPRYISRNIVIGGLIGFAAATAVGVAASRKGDRDFYASLRRPKFAPPSWVFPIAWSGLNLAQVWADAQLLTDRSLVGRGRVPLIALRVLSWTLYGLFTPAFFRARSPVLAEAVTWGHVATTGAVIAIAAPRAPRIAVALAPLALWLGFAGVLSSSVARRNPDPVVDGAAARVNRWGQLPFEDHRRWTGDEEF